jgi:hypothetical protein
MQVDRMSIEAKADLIARSSNQLHSKGPIETEVLEVFLSTTGKQLALLKRMLDGDIGLHELVFERMHSGLREKILNHIKDHADDTPQHCIVLCDIDDTFWASWKDHRYPTQTVYPGCLQFLNDIQGADGVCRANQEKDYHTKLCASHEATFLTARPPFLRASTQNKLRSAGLPHCTSIHGAIINLLANSLMAAKKRQNYCQYRQLYPEAQFVFIGDNGQADHELALMLMEDEEERGQPNSLKCFIHDIKARSTAEEITHRTHNVDSHGVTLFRSYAGAAIAAQTQGMISNKALFRVAQVLR